VRVARPDRGAHTGVAVAATPRSTSPSRTRAPSGDARNHWRSQLFRHGWERIGLCEGWADDLEGPRLGRETRERLDSPLRERQLRIAKEDCSNAVAAGVMVAKEDAGAAPMFCQVCGVPPGMKTNDRDGRVLRVPPSLMRKVPSRV
jgi:hypothetical protein